MRGDKAEERRKGVVSSNGGCQWCLSLPLAARHCTVLRYRNGMADSRKQHKQHKQHSLMQPNSKTGRRLTALPVALRHNGPWRYTIVEYMMGRGTACNSRGAGAGCRCQSMPQRPQRTIQHHSASRPVVSQAAGGKSAECGKSGQPLTACHSWRGGQPPFSTKTSLRRPQCGRSQ